MEPIFDQDSNLVAWFNGKHFFDTDMNWIAFETNEHVFSTDCEWLGTFRDGSLNDKSGKVIAWMRGCDPHGSMRPMTPMRPMKPMQPMRPMRPMRPMKPMKRMTPLGGWSVLGFDAWLAGQEP